jgi:glycosyltransferase A (GT-A) superfamily protein (DUF2064 family)
MPSDRTAILFFSHRPEREWQNKWFVQEDYAKQRQVAEAFYQHASQAVAESGLPVQEVNGAEQRGDTFGTRLANAAADVFADGYERVIIVGGDCPSLHEVEWAAVADQLDQDTPVLGPTPERDGAYLIGMTQAHFDPEAFAALPWKTSALFPALARHLDAASGPGPAMLAPRADVNGHDDLVALLRRHAAPRPLVVRLRRVLGEATRFVRVDQRDATRHVLERRSRGPPQSPLASSRAR